ncbi:HEAT repeat domain-containing protein [Flexivirga caeni]|uniref:HEAT repeat domain-containing protein n=1 Tax=Flexivirga caeni TaxID=2294115 RepID=A0A3M9M1U8_9MICO|nr:HEAT repeat domain-containing protein [Flexivirga caeni]RNI19524.1 HEAT repeat domain-containing protein [Flexivirga caeni]
MSCVTFLTAAQRAALRDLGEEQLTPDEITALHPSPPATEGKLRRVRLLARSSDPAIRQSAALNQHCPLDVLQLLADDSDPTVRRCVARQPATPEALLWQLASDPTSDVRAWVAAHPAVTPELLDRLDSDPEPAVRRVVAWSRAWHRPA